MLYRNAAARSILRAISSSNAPVARSALAGNAFRARLMSSVRYPARPTATPSLALAAHRPVTTALVRYASATTGSHEGENEPDMTSAIKKDFGVIKETFSLAEVPKDALWLGLAGVVPYLATSLQTVYLAYETNLAAAGGSGLLLSGQTAELALHLLEPIQIGYGAVILSFLGAIHWGFEWAGYGGKFGWKRYAPGVIAPAVAWPTLLFPVEYALISQFLAFTFLYYNDARAAGTGAAPHWYGMYRFVLTFIVGASIVASLVGRQQIATSSEEHTIADKVSALLYLRQKEQEEAEARRKAEIEEAE